MVNTPIPHSLKSEAKKAAKILREFTMPSARAGPDKLIPGECFVFVTICIKETSSKLLILICDQLAILLCL